MAYLHEKAMMDATKSLYILGRSSAKRNDGAEVGKLGAGMSSIAGGLKSKQADKLENDKKRAVMSNAIENAKKQQAMANDYDQFERAENRQLRADTDAIKFGTDDPFKRAKMQMDTNRAAENAPIGGKFTRPGFKRMIDQAEVEAEDINTARSMIRGMSGTGEVW